MTREKIIIIEERDHRRIKWCCDAGDLHIVWPETLHEYELEAIEALFGMALRQMKRIAAANTPSGPIPTGREAPGVSISPLAPGMGGQR